MLHKATVGNREAEIFKKKIDFFSEFFYRKPLSEILKSQFPSIFTMSSQVICIYIYSQKPVP